MPSYSFKSRNIDISCFSDTTIVSQYCGDTCTQDMYIDLALKHELVTFKCHKKARYFINVSLRPQV